MFSNGIITLTVLALVLLTATGDAVNALVPLRDRSFHRVRDGRVRHDQTPPHASGSRLAAQAGNQSVHRRDVDHCRRNLRGREVHRGRLAGGVALPLLVGVLIRLNREYPAEAAILEQFRTDRPDLVKYG